MHRCTSYGANYIAPIARAQYAVLPDDGVIMHRDAEHPQNWRDQLGQVHVR
jgi:hypothetical protein